MVNRDNRLYLEKFGDFMFLDGVSPNIKVVHFTGPGNTIHNNSNEWIKDYWK